MQPRRIHQLPTAWMMVFVLLSTAPALRLADVQLLEMLQGIRFLVVISFFVLVGLKIPRNEIWTAYGLRYVVFFALVGVVSLFAIRLTFYPPPDLSILKAPFVLSGSRMLELALAVYFMLAIADTLRQRPEMLRKALGNYSAAGAVSAAISISAFVVSQYTGESVYFVNDLDHRVQGLFNEGGPYGLFLSSVILTLLMRRRLYPDVSRLIHWAAFSVVIIALLLSSSKAGLLAGILCGAISAAFLPDARKRVVAALVLPLAAIAFFIGFQRGFAGYVNSMADFDETVVFRPNDRNLVMGRIVAAFTVPRMIAAHPLLGIGLGNYSLMRNAPEYLRGLPAVDDWDLPGLGLISDAAELGIPLTVFLLLLVWRPFRRAKIQKAVPVVLATAAFQPIALLLGVNLNFFYPWLISAFVLGSFDQTRPSAIPAISTRRLPLR